MDRPLCRPFAACVASMPRMRTTVHRTRAATAAPVRTAEPSSGSAAALSGTLARHARSTWTTACRNRAEPTARARIVACWTIRACATVGTTASRAPTTSTTARQIRATATAAATTLARTRSFVPAWVVGPATRVPRRRLAVKTRVATTARVRCQRRNQLGSAAAATRGGPARSAQTTATTAPTHHAGSMDPAATLGR